MKGRRSLLGLFFLVCLLGMGHTERIAAQGSLEDDFEEYSSAIEADFYSFEDSINHDFADFLEQAWQEFTVYEGTEPPLYAGNGSANAISSSLPAARTQEGVDNLFFGRLLQFASFPGKTCSLSGFSEKQVADGWRQLAAADFTSFFETYTRYSNEMGLNGWGNYLLFKQISRQGYPLFTTEERTLFLFYVLSNSSYKVKIGRVGERSLVLLLPFAEEVYKLPFIWIDKEKYYLVTAPQERLKNLYSFVVEHPKAKKALSLAIRKKLLFPEKRTNRNLLDFYATFPLCDLSVYFRAEPSASFARSMDAVIKKNLAGKSRLEQVAWLLDFVQHTFVHRPDVEVHGSEVYYFPEETGFYPYADCEDLSVFLSWLVRRYTSCRVLTLYYPLHVAVAVEFCEGYAGNLLMYQDEAYFICDPSYKGGRPGMVIPACLSVKPTVVSYFK